MNPSQRKKPKKPISMGSNANNMFFDSVERYNCIEENDNKYALEFYAYMSNKYKLTSEELSKHFLELCKNAIKERQQLVLDKERIIRGIPPNQGKKWSPSDIQRLIELFKSGHSVNNIAKSLGRSELSILLIFRQYILKGSTDVDKVLKNYPSIKDETHITIIKTGKK